MKHSEMLNLNLPEDNDLINVGHISGNFEKIDSAFQTLPVKQNQSKTDIDVMACPPYWTMHNATDEDIVYIDHNFFDEEFTLEAGQTITNEIEEPVNIRISSEVTIDYTWFIPASEAFSGGGGGGTSDYNKLTNLPTINNVEIKNNKTADDLGLVAKENGKGLSTNDFSNAYKTQLDGLDDALDAKLNANSVGVAGGVAELGNDGKVPSSQLPDPVAQKEYKLVEASAEGYAKSYKLQVKNGETWSDISDSSSINIPKDMVVESGSIKECTTDNVPVSGYKKGDKYIDLVIANKADAHIYINVKDLVDNKAEGIQYSNITSKLTATNVQSAIDEIAALAKGNESAISNINEVLEEKVNQTELSSAINDVKTNILSTVVASSNASASNAKTVDFQGTGKALEKLVIEGKTSQDGTPSPSAPVEVKGVGEPIKNYFKLGEVVAGILDASHMDTPFNSGNTTFSVNDTKINITTTSSWRGVTVTDYFPIKPNTTYYAAYKTDNSNVRIYLVSCDSNKSGFSFNQLSSSSGFTTSSRAAYGRLTIQLSVGDSVSIDKIMIIEESNYNGDYIPYNEFKYKIPISVAGKSSNIYLNAPLFNTEILDTETGTANKKYGMMVFDGTQTGASMTTFSGHYTYRIYITDMKKNGGADGFCDRFAPTATRGTQNGITFSISSDSTATLYITFADNTGITTIEQANAWLAANPTTVVYPLATTTKETFDAPEIATTVGKNTLSINTDVTPAKVEVTSFGEYYSKSEVDKMLGNYAKSANIFNTSITNYLDKDKSSMYQYYNPHTKRVIIGIEVYIKAALSASNMTEAATLGEITSENYLPSYNISNPIIAPAYKVVISKSKTNKHVAFRVLDGTIPADTTLTFQLEWQLF